MANNAGVDAQIDELWNDNTNEDITPERLRTVGKLITSSYANNEDTASITGNWTFQTTVTGIAPTADLHLATKKYVDDNIGSGSGDVTGPSSSSDNEIVTFNSTTGKVVQANSGVTISDTGNFAGVGDISFGTALNTIAGIQNQNLLDKTVNETIASGAVWTFTDSPIVPTPTTDFQVATKKYVDDNSGAGDVTATGTPADNQLAVWDSASSIEGDSNLTWNGATFAIGGATTATTFNGVALTTAGSAANVLSEAGTYVALSGGGDVTKVGTPVNNQVGVWTGDGTLEGDSNFTWSGTTLAVTGSQTISSNLTVSGATGLADTTIEIDSATTDASITALEITRTTSGTPAVGIGTDIEFIVETSASNTEKLGVIEVTATDITSAAEDGKMSFLVMQNGTTPTEKMAISSAGNVTATQFNGVALTATGSSANYLREDGTYGSIGSLGGGDVNKVGTPSNNQLGVWTGDGTIEGDANFTWDGSTAAIVGALTATTTITSSGVLKSSDTTDASSTTTGALQTLGGLGVSKKAFFGDEINVDEITADTTLLLDIGGTNQIQIESGRMFGNSSGYFEIQTAAGVSSSQPVYTFRGDNNTGMGRNASGVLNFIISNNEKLTIDSTDSTFETNVEVNGNISYTNDEWTTTTSNPDTRVIIAQADIVNNSIYEAVVSSKNGNNVQKVLVVISASGGMHIEEVYNSGSSLLTWIEDSDDLVIEKTGGSSIATLYSVTKIK